MNKMVYVTGLSKMGSFGCNTITYNTPWGYYYSNCRIWRLCIH